LGKWPLCGTCRRLYEASGSYVFSGFKAGIINWCLWMETFKEIGDQFEIDNDRTVRSVFERIRKRLNADCDLACKMEKIERFN
jgi:hypothetical protein